MEEKSYGEQFYGYIYILNLVKHTIDRQTIVYYNQHYTYCKENGYSMLKYYINARIYNYQDFIVQYNNQTIPYKEIVYIKVGKHEKADFSFVIGFSHVELSNEMAQRKIEKFQMDINNKGKRIESNNITIDYNYKIIEQKKAESQRLAKEIDELKEKFNELMEKYNERN